MKTTGFYLFIISLLMVLGSCGVNRSWVVNQNQNNTQVELNQKNFTVVSEVTGQAEVSYALIFGGTKKKALFQEAYRELVEKANLTGTSRVLTNLQTEEQLGGVPPFYYTRTVTLRTNVVEFTR